MFMNLDVKDWKYYKIDTLFDVALSKGDIKENDIDEGTIPLISSGTSNNGVVKYINSDGDGIAQLFDGNKITVDMFCQAFYQTDNFYCVSHGRVNILTPKTLINKYIALFITTIINKEQYRFSYGRGVYSNVIRNMTIKLPSITNDDGTYSPDWQFMEDYIKSLHHKPITTKNKSNSDLKLDVNSWKDFLLFDYFDILPGKYHYSHEYDEGTTPYYSASNENNGIGQYIDLHPDFKGNCIVTGKIGCTAFYAPDDFCATSDVNIFKPKFDMSKHVGLFITTLINFSENYKWAYGRQCRVGDSKQITIKLPVDSKGNPDFEFMENYIKSLPYGDRI